MIGIVLVAGGIALACYLVGRYEGAKRQKWKDSIKRRLDRLEMDYWEHDDRLDALADAVKPTKEEA